MPKRKIWMKVTDDMYELPVAVADTAKELAMICGRTESSILTMASKSRHGKHTGHYVAVEYEEGEDDG